MSPSDRPKRKFLTKGYDLGGFLKCLFLLLSDTSPPLLLPKVISTSAFCLFPPAALPLCVHISVPLFHKGFGNLAALRAFTRFLPVTEGPSSPCRVLCAILTSRTCLPRDSLKKMYLAFQVLPCSSRVPGLDFSCASD